METHAPFGVVEPGRRMRTWLGFVLIAAGGMGHVLAAQAIGGNYVAYRDHMAGFIGSTVLLGAILMALGRFFWRRRFDITVLTLGIIQALFGLYIYIERFNIGHIMEGG